MADIQYFHYDQVTRYADDLIAVYKEKFITEKNPKAYVLGGQPGAGKTTLQDFFYRKQYENLILLNGDNFRKGHPAYKRMEKIYGKEAVHHTGGFSGKVTEYLVEKLSDEGYPLLVEGTLRTVEVPGRTALLLKGKGYITEFSLIATKPELSYLGTILRYEMQLNAGMFARITSKSDHDYVVEKIMENLEVLYQRNLFDHMTIFDREGTCLYSKEKNVGSPTAIVAEKLFGVWDCVERELFCEQVQRVISLMRKRDAPELPHFIQETDRIKEREKMGDKEQ